MLKEMDILASVGNARKTFKEDFSEYLTATSSSWNSFGGLVYEDGYYQRIGKYVCHGWLGDSAYRRFLLDFGAVPVKFILSAVMKSRSANSSKVLRYHDWLINRSTWADVFVEKDAVKAVEFGHVIDASKHPSLIATACIASRFQTEAYTDGLVKREKLYYDFLEGGFTEDEAFLFTHLYNPTRDRKSYPVTFSRFSSGHSTFLSSGWSKQYAKNFLTRTLDLTKDGVQDMKRGGYMTNSLNCIWGKKEEADSLGIVCKRLKPSEVKLAEDFHIFRKAPSNSYEYKDSSDLMDVARQLKEWIYA